MKMGIEVKKEETRIELSDKEERWKERIVKRCVEEFGVNEWYKIVIKLKGKVQKRW